MILTETVKSLWSHNPLPRGCVLYLPLWALRGDVFRSVDYYRYKLTNTGSVYKVGEGRVFDGDDFIKHTVANWRSGDNVGSISFWVKSSNSGQQVVFTSADEAGILHQLQCGIRGTTGEPFINVKSAPNDGIKGNTAITDGAFHFVTISSNGSAWRIDLDGADDGANVIVGVNSGTWLADCNARDNVVIGVVIQSSNANFMNGTIGEVWYHSRQITLAEHQYIRRMTRWRYQ